MTTTAAFTGGFAEDLLKLYFLNTAILNVGNAAGLVGSSGAGSPGSLYISLHSADPGETGDQSTNELSYSGYSRLAVARDGTKWEVVDAGGGLWIARNPVLLTFGDKKNDVGSVTATWYGIGRQSGTGATELDWRIQIEDPVGGLVIPQGITPQVPINGIQAGAT